MAILMFVARIHALTSSLMRHQARMTEITDRLHDLTNYGASIMDGVSMDDMMNTPASMFGRMWRFSSESHRQAMMMSDAQFYSKPFQTMLAMQTQGMDPQSLQAYMFWVKDSLYKQARETFNKREEKLLKHEEQKLTQEKEKLEAIIKMEEADLKSAKEARDKGIEQMAPKYTG